MHKMKHIVCPPQTDDYWCR